MKPIFLVFFFLIIFSFLVFGVVIMYDKALIEENPAPFSLSLLGAMVFGMIGMMRNIISTAPASSRK